MMENSAPQAPPGFEQLVLPHLDAAYNLARWLLRHEQDAEDAVQDAFVRAHRSFVQFRGGDGRGWLLTIVRNVCYSKLRDVKRHAPLDLFDENLHTLPDQDGEMKAIDWLEVNRARLQNALEKLTPEFREVIVLHEIEGLAYREIAHVAGIPIGTVMSRLARARQKLQSELRPPVGQEPAHDL